MKYAALSFLIAIISFLIGMVVILYAKKNKFNRRIHKSMMAIFLSSFILGISFTNINDIIEPYVDKVITKITKDDKHKDDISDDTNNTDDTDDIDDNDDAEIPEYTKLCDFVGDTLGVTEESSKRTMFVTAKNDDNIEDVLWKNGATNVSRFKKNAFHQDECVLMSVFDSETSMKKAKDDLIGYDVSISDDDSEVELTVSSENYDYDFKREENPIGDVCTSYGASILDPEERPYSFYIHLFDTGIDDDDVIGHGTTMRDVIHSESYYAIVDSYNVFNDQPTTNASMMAASLLYGTSGNLGVYNISASGFGHSKALEFAIDKLVNSYNGNVVVAAGNNSDDANNYAPGNIASAITVGAYDKNTKTLADYSNYGDCIDYICDGEFNGKKGTSIASARMSSYVACILNENIPCENVTDVLDMLSTDVDGYKYINANESEIVDACNKYKNKVKEECGIDIDSMFFGMYNEEYGAEYNLYGEDIFYSFCIDEDNMKLAPAYTGPGTIMNRNITVYNIPIPYACEKTGKPGNGLKLNTNNIDVRIVKFVDPHSDYSYESALDGKGCQPVTNAGDYYSYNYIECHPYKRTDNRPNMTDFALGNATFKKDKNGKTLYYYLDEKGNKSKLGDKPSSYTNCVPAVSSEKADTKKGVRTNNLFSTYNSAIYRIDRYAYSKIELNDIVVGDSSITYTPYVFVRFKFESNRSVNVYSLTGIGFDKFLKKGNGDDITVNNVNDKVFPLVYKYEFQKTGFDATGVDSFYIKDSKTNNLKYVEKESDIPLISLMDIKDHFNIKGDGSASKLFGITHYRSQGQGKALIENGVASIYEGAGGVANEIYLYPGRHRLIYRIAQTKNGAVNKFPSSVISNETSRGDKIIGTYESNVTISSATEEVLVTHSLNYIMDQCGLSSQARCVYCPERSPTFSNCWVAAYLSSDRDYVVISPSGDIFVRSIKIENPKLADKYKNNEWTNDHSSYKSFTVTKNVDRMRMMITKDMIFKNCFYFMAVFEEDICRFLYQREPSGKNNVNKTKVLGLVAVCNQKAEDKAPGIEKRIKEEQEIVDAEYELIMEAYQESLDAYMESIKNAEGSGPLPDPPEEPPEKRDVLKEYLDAHNDSHPRISDCNYCKRNCSSVKAVCFHDAYDELLRQLKNMNSIFKDMTYYDAKERPKQLLHDGRNVTVSYNANSGKCQTKKITVSKGYETNVVGTKASSGKKDSDVLKPRISSQVEDTAEAALYLANNYKKADNTSRDKAVVNLCLSVNDGTLLLPDAWRSGYIFKGWYKNGKFFGKAGELKTLTDAECKKSFTLTAMWEPIQFRVLYVTNIPSDYDDSTNLNRIESHSLSSNTGFDKININTIKSYRAAMNDEEAGGTSTKTASSDATTSYTSSPNSKYYSYVGKKKYVYDGNDWSLEEPDITVNDMYFTGWTYYDILWNGTYTSYNSDDDAIGSNSNGDDGKFISNVPIGNASELVVFDDGEVIETTERSENGNIGKSLDDCYYTSDDLRYKQLVMQKNPFSNYKNNQPCCESPSKDKGYTNSTTGDKTNNNLDDSYNLYLVLKANWSSDIGNVPVTYHSNNDANSVSNEVWYNTSLTNYTSIRSITSFGASGFGRAYDAYDYSGTARNVKLVNATSLARNNISAFQSGKYALGDDGSYDGSTSCDQFVISTASNARYYFGKSNGRTGLFSFQGWSPWKHANWRDSIDITKKDTGSPYSFTNEYQPNGHDSNETKTSTTTENNGIPEVTRYNDAFRSKRVGDLFYRYGVTTISHDNAYNGSRSNQNSGSSYVSDHTYSMSSQLYDAYHWRWQVGFNGHYNAFINLISNPSLTLYEIWDCYPTTDIQNVYVYTQDDTDDDLSMLTPKYLFSKAVVYDYEDFESLGGSRKLGDSSHTWSSNCQPTSNMNSKSAGSYSYIYNMSSDSSMLGYVDGRFTATLMNYDYQAFVDAKTIASENVKSELKNGAGTANDVQSVALTWKFEDSAGNITYHTSWVYIIDRASENTWNKSDSGDTDDTRYAITRFIDERSYFGDGSKTFTNKGSGISVNDDESTGGVQYRSKWKLNSAYVSELSNSLHALRVIGDSKLTLGDFVRDANGDGIMDTWGFNVIWSGDYHPQNNGDGTWTYPWESIKSQCDGVYQLDYNAIVETKKFVQSEGNGGSGNYNTTDHSTLKKYIDKILGKPGTAIKRVRN